MKKYGLKTFIMILTLIILTCLDQLTKFMAVKYLKNKPAVPLIKGVLEFEYLENTGAAYGMLRGMRIVFIILTMILAPLFVFVIVKIEKEISVIKKSGVERSGVLKKYAWLQFIIVILFSGAIGNFIDRLINGYVIDFIYFKLIDFPIFNVADCYVTSSVIVIIIFVVFVLSGDELDKLVSFGKES